MNIAHIVNLSKLIFLEQLSLTNERTRAEHDKGLTPTQQQHEQCHLPINAIDKFSFSVTQDCLDP